MGSLDDWPKIAAQVTMLTAAGQLATAGRGVEYVLDVLPEPVATVNPRAFAGVAPDGRALDTLLYSSVVHAREKFSKVADQLESGRKWLGMLVHTAVADAGRSAAGAQIAATPDAGWMRMVSPPCCQRCAVLAGKEFKWNAGFERHPRCFPAGVLVSGPSVEAAARRWYEGELAVLTTASGQELPITGNHPVLTRRGWLPAHLIHEGDEVVRSTRPQGAAPLVVPDHHQVPALIEDVWGALGVGGFVSMPTAPEDFHGDGQVGEVDIVRAYGAVERAGLAALGHEVPQQGFARTAGLPLGFDLERSSELVELWDGPHPGCSVCGGHLEPPLIQGHLRDAHLTGVARPAPLHPGLFQSASNDVARDAVLAGQGVLAGAGVIGGSDLLVGQRELLARWDAPGAQFSVETRGGYSRRGLDLLDRLAGQVELDRVVELRRREWSGHVYSLTSSEGWHSANSLIVSNCDCTHVPTIEGKAADGYEWFIGPEDVKDLTVAQRKAIADGGDFSQVINAHRAESRSANLMTTSEGTTRQGWASYMKREIAKQRGEIAKETVTSVGPRGFIDNYVVRRTAPRLTPEAIYRVSATREEAVRLLAKNGYIVGPIKDVARLAG
jgi:hypothetical protein